MMKKTYALLYVLSLMVLPGCESKTENAAEDVTEAVEDAADEVADEAEDAADEVQDAVDQ